MGLPNVYEEIKDGGLGLITPADAGVFGIVGNAAAGDVETIYTFNDPATAEDTFSSGTLLERILDAFANGAKRILAVRTDTTGGAAADAGTPVLTGTGTGQVTATGTPTNDRDFKLKITDAGVDGSLVGGGVKIKISRNGGLTWGDEIALSNTSPQTIDLDNGSSAVMTDNATPAGSWVAGDIWTWSCTEAKPTSAKLMDAVEVLGENNEVAWIHVSDQSDSTDWAAVSTYNATLETNHKYIFFVMEAPRPEDYADTTAWISALQTEAASYYEKRVLVCAGHGLLVDRRGEAINRNVAGCISGLIAGAPVQESIGWVREYKINNCQQILPTDLTEADIETIDGYRYTTIRFWPGYGFRVTNGRLMATDTSDFRYLETLRVCNKAIKVVRAAAVPFVQALADDAGLIAYQKSIEAPLEQMKVDGEIDDYELLIPEGQNVTSTGEVTAQLTIVPKPIMRKLTLVFGLGAPRTTS